MLSGSANGELFLWDMKNHVHVHTFPRRAGGVWSVALSPNGRLAVTGGLRGDICVWDLRTRLLKRTLRQARPAGVPGVAFTPDGGGVVTCEKPGPLRLWDVEAGTPLRAYGPAGKGDGERYCVAVSKDGQALAAGSDDGVLRLYDLNSGAEARACFGHRKGVRRTAFAPDGRHVVSCGFDGQVILWEVKTGKEVRRFEGHPGFVEWAGFSPDGRTLLTTEGPIGNSRGVILDQGLRLWDVRSGKQLHRHGDIPEKVHCAAFSPDGRRVVVGCGDHKVRLYDVGWITARP
jgi:WD40 repeat protein